ncbi:hypothetical protein PRIPAC_80443, partial [Pristionchus pacificus]
SPNGRTSSSSASPRTWHPSTLTDTTSAPPLGPSACIAASRRSQHLPQQLRQFFRKRHPQGSQVEALKWVDKSENGKGRILSKQGRKDLDRIAADLRSTVAPLTSSSTSGSVIRKALKRGRKDLDRIAADLRSTAASAEL